MAFAIPEHARITKGGDMSAWLRSLEFRVEEYDDHRLYAWLALIGLVLGAVMAVFGLPPVDIHGPLHYLGIMDPLCGGTRPVWAAMSGDLAESWRYNPLGIPLVVGAVVVLLRLVFGMMTGRWVNIRLRSWPIVAVVGGVLFGLLAIRQQLNVDLLRSPPGEFSLLGPVLNALPVLVLAIWVSLRRRRMLARSDRPS
ncbi:DUF2752 domain-containing protein [Nocardiopsis dassonvillei]|uniref:DUF2752 domain-containing protein n=1 Tax=Nocardiopsis dassonvillei TaxID=2014 RepID=UPI00200E17CF|nr:DUF2752 domain-containing protein [Nocardiopsis dassonvillei]MCK9872371.1 DUF2752 domain-containing protein [Nocardiopsis dassonvillei]